MITVEVEYSGREKKTTKTLTHPDGSQTITTTIEELSDEEDTEEETQEQKSKQKNTHTVMSTKTAKKPTSAPTQENDDVPQVVKTDTTSKEEDDENWSDRPIGFSSVLIRGNMSAISEMEEIELEEPRKKDPPAAALPDATYDDLDLD
jgi:hypothetical protein